MNANIDNQLADKWDYVKSFRAELKRKEDEEVKKAQAKIANVFSEIDKRRTHFKENEDAIRKADAQKILNEAKFKKQELMKQRWSLANVPELFRKSKLEPFCSNPVEKQDKIDCLNQMRVIEQIRDLKFLSHNVVFYGFYGLGKSYFSSYFTRKAIVEGASAGFISASDYIRFCRKDLVRAERFEEMGHLVLDEVGNGDIPKWDIVLLKDLLIRRSGNGLKTLITTNLTPVELREYLKGTAQDRMLNASTIWIDFNQIDGACSLRGRV